MDKGKIICITGCDRVGKATQSKLLAQVLNAHSISFPDYSTITGQLIRAALTKSYVELDRKLYPNRVEGLSLNSQEYTEHTKTFEFMNKNKMSPYSFQMLQMICRLEKQNEIRSVLESGQHIVADRYDVDTLVYGLADGCDETWTRNFLGCIIPSDLVLVLFGDQQDRHEVADLHETNVEFMNKVRQIYRKICYLDASTDCYTEEHNYNKYVPIDVVEAKDKYVSILLTHEKIVEVIKEKIDYNIEPLSIKDIGKIIE